MWLRHSPESRTKEKIENIRGEEFKDEPRKSSILLRRVPETKQRGAREEESPK